MKGLSLREIANERQLVPSTIETQLIRCMELGLPLDLTRIPLSRENYDEIWECIKTIQATSPNQDAVKHAVEPIVESKDESDHESNVANEFINVVTQKESVSDQNFPKLSEIKNRCCKEITYFQIRCAILLHQKGGYPS